MCGNHSFSHGVSTRAVDDLVKAMGASGISKSQVSRLCAEIDERVNAFLARPIEGAWPYLWIDATYLKSRQAGRIVSVAVIIAVGVNTDGRREVLGVATGASEAEPFWTAFLRSLADRGLRGVKLADLMDGSREDVLVYMAFPREHWAQDRLRRTRSSGSTARSSAAPTWSAFSRMTRLSSNSWARSCSNRMTSGRSRAAT